MYSLWRDHPIYQKVYSGTKSQRKILMNFSRFNLSLLVGEQLVKIPTRRVMTYREDLQDDYLIGKPRFEPKNLEWDSKLLINVRDHLQEIWNLFAQNSYWFDDRLKEILLYERRRLSKKSILFLLECDVWESDEVYGDYLIENNEGTTKISYFRFYHKFKTFSLPKKSYSEREIWIKKNAIDQIVKK